MGLTVQQEVRVEALRTDMEGETAYRTPQLRWIWIWRTSAAREAGRRTLRRTARHFAWRTD